MNQFLRIYLLLLMVVVSIDHSFAQAWPEIGATWYYNNQYPFSATQGYFHFECQKDTVVMGKTCRKIKKYSQEECEMMIWPFYKLEIAYTSNDSIYLLDSLNGKKIFQLYMYRNAQKGDSWKMIYLNSDQSRIDTIFFTIDSLDSVILKGKTLKRHYISARQSPPNPNFASVKMTHIERIGMLKYMTEYLPSKSGCDMPYATGLRCFTDSYIGYYNTGIVDTCDKYIDWTGIEGEDLVDQLKVYPNPFSDRLSISSESALRNAEVNIRNSTGRLILSLRMPTVTNYTISTPFPSGIYYLEIRSNGKILRMEKLIKY